MTLYRRGMSTLSGVRPRSLAAAGTVLLLAPLLPLAAWAHNGADTPKAKIVGREDVFAPVGKYDDQPIGFRVYLSSPRHSDSGSRGECGNGYEENINGRKWNWLAANGSYHGGPTSQFRNLHGRGYTVMVSQNTRDGGYLDNREQSRNWGARIHIITHSNAFQGCPSSANYLLTMYNESNDQALAGRLAKAVGPVTPGGVNQSRRTDLAELTTGARRGDAYVELAFHDHRKAQRWMHDRMQRGSYTYGVAVDKHLGYPQRLPADSALPTVPGFGESAEQARRDDQIAAYATWRRERAVSTCMQRAGFDYRADPGLYPLADADLTLAPGARAAAPADVANDRLFAGLDADGRDAYWRALVGESATDVRAADDDATAAERAAASARLTAPDFAEGGCRGEARRATPDLWRLPQQLDADLATAQQSADRTPAVARARSSFDACVTRTLGRPVARAAATGEGALEDAVAAGSIDIDAATRADNTCAPALDEARSAAYGDAVAAITAEHRSDLATQTRRFGAWERLSRTDPGFAAAVAAEQAG